MLKEGKETLLSEKETSLRHAGVKKRSVPPHLFQHEDLAQILESADSIDQGELTNLLHYVHFLKGYVNVLLRHVKYEESTLVRAYPEPCRGGRLRCLWSDEKPLDLDFNRYQFLHLVIDVGRSMILVPAAMQEMNSESLTVQLPDTSYVIGQRQARRYASFEVVAELIQSGVLAK